MSVQIHNSEGILQKLCKHKPFWFIGVCLSSVYFIVAKLGLTFTTVADNVTLIWPPSGLALFALLIFSSKFWPWIFIGTFITNLTTGIALLPCLGIAMGNTLEALAGVYLLERVGFNSQLSRVRDVLYLALYAAGFSTMVAATIGTFSLTFFGVIPWSVYPKAWITWWMGDSMGILAFTPLLLSWWFPYSKQITKSFLIEAAILITSTILVTEFVFGLQYYFFSKPLPLAYLTFPFILWTAMRFSLRGVTTMTFIIGAIILFNIILDIGLFVSDSTLQSLVLLWLYTNFLAITSIALTSAIEEREKAELGMRHLAEHDHLTHLPNRRALVDRIGQAIVHAERNDEKFAVLFLDLDRFKIVNDSLGHSKGDQMLTIISLRLLQCVRKEDTVSRLGGDEFVILIREIKHMEDVYKITNKILTMMRKPINIDDSEIHSSVSIGICLYPNDATNAETLLKHADIAMYRAKDAGRNNYQFYSSDMNELVETRLSIENDLRHALKNNEYQLYYQPQFDVLDGKIKGCEALIRWCKDGEFCTGPATFIPILEETGQIKEVGVWVIQEACRQLSAWNAKGFTELRMSVNISSHQLSDDQLPRAISDALALNNIDPKYLEIEITESMLVRQEARVEKVIQSLVALGVRLAIDDFGTGYSSLSYLHRLSIDTLKVDRSFVEKIPGNANSEAIAKAIVGLGKSLQLDVVAEGIENEAQCAFISGLGCDYVQGFLLSRPVTGYELTIMLETNQSNSPICFSK